MERADGSAFLAVRARRGTPVHAIAYGGFGPRGAIETDSTTENGDVHPDAAQTENPAAGPGFPQAAGSTSVRGRLLRSAASKSL
ncbi:MAG: hypothetical protein AB7K35_14525 [Pseudorhodoplanes sp.]